MDFLTAILSRVPTSILPVFAGLIAVVIILFLRFYKIAAKEKHKDNED